MYSDFFTNKWVLGGITFLIVFGIACVFWYHYDTAPVKRDTAKAERIARQLQNRKEANTDNITENDINDTQDNSMLSKEIPQSETTDSNSTKDPYEVNNTKDIGVSPYGFGPYPQVPEDYPSKHLVKWPEDSPSMELLSRVLIKLWTDGERNFRGGSNSNGKVYPHYNDVVYVRFAEYKTRDGNVVRYAARTKSGPQVSYTKADLLNPPPHLRVLDLDSSGINPYDYLNFQHKGEK